MDDQSRGRRSRTLVPPSGSFFASIDSTSRITAFENPGSNPYFRIASHAMAFRSINFCFFIVQL